ncbi:MAG: cation-translocating P-type ATPase [Raoultibacter sp.]
MKCACGCSETNHTPHDHKEASTCGSPASPACGCATVDGHASAAAPTCTQDDGCGCGHDHEEGMKPHEKWCLLAAGVLIAASLVFDHLLGNDFAALLLSFAAIVAGLVIVLPETLESLKAKSIDINVLLIVAIIGAVYVQAYEEAAAVLFLFSVGEYLEGRALRKSSDAISDLAKLAPATALVVRAGQTLEVATDEVALGETIALRPGTAAPLDGIITKGASAFNDAAITGESAPVRKTVGDKVFAASLALDGACQLKTTSTVADSTLAKIADLVQDAQKQKSQRESFVQRFAKVYTPIVIACAVLIAFVPPALGALGIINLGSLDTWIYRACELLVISCPCAFVISTPVTVVSALTRAAKMGVLVKGGAFFEEAARVSVVAFDKTGTLTQGTPTVCAVALAPTAGDAGSDGETDGEAGRESDAESVLRIAAALEAHSTHPLAQAVVAYAHSQSPAPTAARPAATAPALAPAIPAALEQATDVREQAGRGLVGTVAGVPYAIGSAAFVAQQVGDAAAVERLTALVAQQVGTTIYLARLGTAAAPLAVFVVADALRAAAPATLAALHATTPAKHLVMLTGDNERVARTIAQQAGVDEVEAGLLPEEKTAHIRRLAAQVGPVAYAGDGINDAPSLATAHVGIAMGGAGSDAALSSADVVLMADDLSALPKFFRLSTKTVAIIRQNVVLAIGLKLLVAALVVFGMAQMWMAVLADTGVSLLVILNGMRLLRVKLDSK